MWPTQPFYCHAVHPSVAVVGDFPGDRPQSRRPRCYALQGAVELLRESTATRLSVAMLRFNRESK
jgi:hypothetical protein